MADGVAITAGSGTTILTDDCGASGHAQGIKLSVSANGDATAIPATAANGLTVDVTRLPALVAGTANIGDVDVLTVPAPLSTTGGGTEATALRVTVATDSTGVLSVDDNGASLTVDNAAIAAGPGGGLLTIGGASTIVSASARITGSNTDVALLPGTIAAGTRVVLTRMHVAISNACTINVGVKVGFGTSTIAADNATGVAGVVVDNDGFPPGGGVLMGMGGGILAIGADGEELRVTNDAPTSGSIHLNYSYYTISP